MACINCGAGMHFECISIQEGTCCCNGQEELPFEDYEEEKSKGRGRSRDSTLKDQQSTGRKRAAKDFPLDRDAACEWAGLKLAGGGKHPIVGCPGNKQEARHHGPDKNTLNNEPGNVHRICHHCHNRWHAANDSVYEPGNPGQAHNVETKATLVEIAHNEAYWARNKPKKVKD